MSCLQESRLNVSKRKAQDPASRATAEGAAALADDPSPPKRMKANTNATADVPTEQVPFHASAGTVLVAFKLNTSIGLTR